jgi:hypothetical protein
MQTFHKHVSPPHDFFSMFSSTVKVIHSFWEEQEPRDPARAKDGKRKILQRETFIFKSHKKF